MDNISPQNKVQIMSRDHSASGFHLDMTFCRRLFLAPNTGRDTLPSPFIVNLYLQINTLSPVIQVE